MLPIGYILEEHDVSGNVVIVRLKLSLCVYAYVCVNVCVFVFVRVCFGVLFDIEHQTLGLHPTRYHMPEGMVDGALFDAMGPGW